MGLFSRLFGEKAGIIDDIANAKRQETLDRIERERETADTVPETAEYTESVPESGPSGFSWGPDMPDEENQYNFNGTYKEYFNDVFRSEFSNYKIESSDAYNGKAVIFTFWEGGRKALVVEVLSRKSSVYKLRADCKAEGVPYLRYYYDHHGWWNTREYVKQRTHNAIAG